MLELNLAHLLVALGMVLVFVAMIAANRWFGDYLGAKADQTLNDLTWQLKSGRITQREFDERSRSASLNTTFPPF
jgi:hypothetical protein